MITVSNLFKKRDRSGNLVLNNKPYIPRSDEIRVIKYVEDDTTKYKLSVRDYGFNTYSLLENGLDEEIFINTVIDGLEYEIESLQDTIGYEEANEYDLARSKNLQKDCNNMLVSIENTLNLKVKQKTLKR